MPWNPATDLFYRAILADIADTEWQIVEAEFLATLERGQPPASSNPPGENRG